MSYIHGTYSYSYGFQKWLLAILGGALRRLRLKLCRGVCVPLRPCNRLFLFTAIYTFGYTYTCTVYTPAVPLTFTYDRTHSTQHCTHLLALLLLWRISGACRV